METAPRVPTRILLFDIDGTLLVSAGAGRAAMDIAFRQLFDLSEEMEPTAGIDFAGASDLRVAHDVAAAHGRDYDAATHDRFLRLFEPTLRATLPTRGGRRLPGVGRLLDRLRDEPVFLGLGTGNFRQTAFVKLAHYELDGYFDASPNGGCFGEDGVTRPEFLAAGIERLRARAAPGADVVVIGDTVLDVSGGRAVGARVVAVDTGFSERSDLIAAGPDVLLDDFSDLDASLTALLG